MRASDGKKSAEHAVNQHQSIAPGIVPAAGNSCTTLLQESDQDREDREVAEQLEQKRLEHERQRIMKRELFEQQMQQLEMQQKQEEQAMLVAKSKAKTSSFARASDPADLSSLAESRSSSEDSANPWGDMGRLSLNDRKLSTIDRSTVGAGRVKASSSDTEADLDDNSHLSQYTERFIFEDDNETSANRLSSLHMNSALHDDGIWNDRQGLGLGSSGLNGSSYLHRYLQLSNDNSSFPTMLSASSSALDLAKAPHTSGLRQPGGQESGQTSEWPQYNKALSDRLSSGTLLPQRANSLVSFSLDSNPEETLSSALPRLTPSYPGSELPGRFSKGQTLSGFNDSTESNHLSLLIKSDVDSGDICLQYQRGYCSRGDLCPYTHPHVLSSTTLSSTSAPLTASSAQAIGTMVSTAPYYAHANNVGSGSLATSGGFQFNAATSSSFNKPTVASGSTMRMQQQQQHASNSIALANKANQKRPPTEMEANRFTGAALESFVGQIYSLCKDQHGCRYLQKKLEEQNEKYLAIIFGEVFAHLTELMTDPFGNYLCQKLLEFCGDEQRTIIVESVAPELVNISLNMHGTRAVQKMIEFLSTPQQIAIVVVALNPSVVTLIKDLNGNHVVQKCLNRFASEDNQFIYNAISNHCVEVATHRHGCCVLQRCIDHASASQKMQLVREITYNALTLVQDPYGNYVVQYVLDLADNRFTDALIRRFIGSVCVLSVQKFSSNVMEKCIRVAEPETRKFLIEEMINKTRLDKLLRDSYANYVVQTSLECADPVQRGLLVDCIRPLLPAIRNTPYGKRIQSKLHRDQMSAGHNHMSQLAMGNMGMNMHPGMGHGHMSSPMAVMNGMNTANRMPNHVRGSGQGLGHGHGMPLSTMAMNGNMPMTNMATMNGSMGGINNVSGNMMGFGFPGINNHFGNVGMIGMNDYNPYAYM
ncbi:hypothetical protein BGZ75_009202 [Mortierella antarctica]|nr:hypothetical protein BGZ75_009202 [Mortierella antarctica]